jgi:phosphatidylglycerol:prolipoprotein diacylglycerol transferase
LLLAIFGHEVHLVAVHKVAFQFGDFTVYWYGVLVALGFLIGLWTATRRGLRDGISGDRLADLGIWLMVGAIVGARLFYVISYWREDFASKPLYEVLLVRKGGLVFYGGLVGAALACVFYVRAKGLPLWKVADALAPSVALGYVFGRLGCFMNGCCYGSVCSWPWAVHFPNNHETYPQGVHPTQLYESLMNVGLYAALVWLYRHKRFDGQVFAAYLMGYAALRWAGEAFRGDYAVRYLGGWATPAQLFGVLVFAAGCALWWRLPRAAQGASPAAR